MKTLEDFKQEQMEDEDFKREYDEIQFIASSRAIKELERIKAEISEITFMTTAHSLNARGMAFTDSINKIIDERIAELKGE